MNRSGTVSFSKEQIQYLVTKTGADSPGEAIEIFSAILQSENVDPIRMPVYVKKMMEKEKTQTGK